MPPDRATRVAEIVEEAIEREPHERAAFLEENCDDTDIRREVMSLLERESGASDFIETPAYRIDPESLAADQDEMQRIGEVIANYKILSLLGEGGMGEVYLAQDLDLGRNVAVKLVRPGSAIRSIVRHFRAEERILAALNHPNIARLYGGGATADGVPYFVMEYIEGERLDVFSSKRELSIEARLKLFQKVCAAVSYAHQHLVIHRDLKPANIRVTDEGEPKLLDFGIAKILDDDATAMPEQTITLRTVMTPDYASPEQVRGEVVTTASDVYSLGVILYELLTSHKPYRVDSTRPNELSRAITEQTPPRPSSVAGSNQKSEVRNRKVLRGDLDNIVLMALRKEPARRYASVADFSEDISRYLAGRPVFAHKATLGYRAGKFVLRNRFAVAAALVLLATLVGGIVATTRQAQIARAERAKAERRFNDVRKLANSFLFELHDAIEKLPGSTPARELLVRRALEYLDKLAAEARGDASLQRELVMAYLKVGNVQGNPTNANLGDTAGALASYAKATATAKSLAGADAQSQRPLALTAEKTADVLAVTGDISGAVKSARASLEIFRRIAESEPGNAGAQESLAISHIKVGDISGNPNFSNAGDAAAALDNYRASLAIWEARAKSDPSSPKVRRFLGVSHERLGTMYSAANDPAQALEHYQQSLAVREALAADDPADTDKIRDSAIAQEKIGNVLTMMNDLPAALDYRSKSLAIFERLAAADPQNVVAQVSLAVSHLHMAQLLADPDSPNLGRAEEALNHCRAGLDILNPINREHATAHTRKIAGELQTLTEKLSSR